MKEENLVVRVNVLGVRCRDSRGERREIGRKQGTSLRHARDLR